MFSTSPRTIFGWLDDSNRENKITLQDFLRELPAIIDGTRASKGSLTPEQDQEDPVADLFCRLSLDPVTNNWQQYAHHDETKNYTRNLVATDGTRYTFLLLCWNPGRASPIHDHPCDGCWMRVLQGTVQERRFRTNHETDAMECISDEFYQESQMAYIADFMGYHMIANPSKTVPAVTLHLYCPPFNSCKIWLDPNSASTPSSSKVCLHSAYGELVIDKTSAAT